MGQRDVDGFVAGETSACLETRMQNLQRAFAYSCETRVLNAAAKF